MKHKKFILSALAVVLVASLGVVLNSCASLSPPPPEGQGQGAAGDITIPKVLLFENTSDVATNVLKAIYYERTVNAHKFYIKTSFQLSNFLDLNNVDSGIVSTKEPWGLLLIGIDIADKSTSSKNVAKFNDIKVKTADPNFEFDAVIRTASHGDRINTNDGIPIALENDNWLLEFANPTGDLEGQYYWSAIIEEKKFQGSTNDNNNKFLSGSPTVVTGQNSTGGSTGGDYIVKVDRNLSYDASTGEYVLTIPFTVIGYDKLDKIVAFGSQNSWRNGKKVVIKPLGSSKAIVYPDFSDTVKGLPVVKIPKSKDQSPQLIGPAFPDVLQGIITSVDAKEGLKEITNNVTLISLVSNAPSNAIVFTGPQGSSTVNITNWLFYGGTNLQGDHLYTNAVIIKYSAESGGGADFYAGTNYTVRVTAGNGGEDIVSVTVEPVINAPSIVLLVDTATVNFEVVDGYSAGTTAIASNANTAATYTVTLSGSGPSYSGSFTIGGSGADLAASGGDTIVIIYNDTTSSKKITASVRVVAGWTLAGPGEYDFWVAKIAAVFYKTNTSTNLLEVLVYFNPLHSDGNQLFVAIDVTNRTLNIDESTNIHDSSGDLTTGLGSFWITNEAGIDFDFVAWGQRAGVNLNYQGANRIESDGSGTSVMGDVTFAHTNLVSANDYYFAIPYSAMRASSGDVVNIYVFFGQVGGTPGYEGIRSIFPANASVVFDPGAGYWGPYVVRLTNKSPDIELP